MITTIRPSMLPGIGGDPVHSDPLELIIAPSSPYIVENGLRPKSHFSVRAESAKPGKRIEYAGLQ